MRAVTMIAWIGMTVLMTACAGNNATEEDNVNGNIEFSQLAQGNSSDVKAERMTVVRDQQALDRIWSEVRHGRERPAVDLESEMVLAIFMGERRTGGYQVRVQEVVREGEGFRVHVRMTAPGPNCMTTQAFTQPWQLISLPRVDGPVEFDVEQREVDC